MNARFSILVGIMQQAALRHMLLVFGLLGVAGCATYPQYAGFNDLLAQPYVLDAGDSLRITVFEQPSLSEVYTVDVSGMVSMPLIGDIPARGLTIDELDGSITTALRDGFLRSPDVAIEIDTYRPFFVLGEVADAGQFPYVAGMTVRTAVAIAGGFTARASRRSVVVSRTLNGEVVTGELGLNDALRPGDIVTVRERWF